MNTKRIIHRLAPWLMLALVGMAAAWLRYGFIEQAALAHQCDAGNTNIPASCSFRYAVVLGFNSYGFGIAALAAMLLALLLKHRSIAWLAAALGLFALIMYCYYAGALALLVGCLRYLRLQANRVPAPVEPHRHGDRHVQPQP